MTRKAKAGVLLAACFVLAAGAASGAGLLKNTWTLTIVVNVPGAQIFVDNKLINGNAVPVVEARHNVRVHADGYYDWSQAVDVSANMTLRVNLNPIVFPLTVRVNVPAATVYVDGVDVTGQAAAVAAGQHTVQVVAKGYKDYNSVVDVSAALMVDVALQPAGVLLTVDANVAGATVIVNDFAKGAVPYAEYLPPGAYVIRVSADGYADYIASVALDRAVTVSAKLRPQPRPQPMPATLSLVIPPAFADPDVRANDPVGQIKIFVDNKLVNGNRALDGIQVAPGRHHIRVASGGLSIDVGDVTVQPGMKYVIELTLDAQIRAVRAVQ
jgi:hypothetical protein